MRARTKIVIGLLAAFSVLSAFAATPATSIVRNVADNTVTVEFSSTEIRTAVTQVADMYNLNVVIPDSLTGTTSTHLRNVTWQQLFAAILRPAGFTYLYDGNVVRVVALPPALSPKAPPVEEEPPVSPIGMLRDKIGEIYDPSKLDQIPTVKVQLRPEYPFEMRRTGIGGVVTVEFIVDTNGKVVAGWPTKSTNPAFEENAVAAVMKWRFTPGSIARRAVNTHMVVDIVFNLNDSGR